MQELSSSERLGHATLDLLALEWMCPVLKCLAGGAGERLAGGASERLVGGTGLRPCEIERSLPGVAHSQLMRRLEELGRRGIVRHERQRGMPPRVHYALTDAGWDLLAIPRMAARWEGRWSPCLRGSSAPGQAAMRIVSDAENRELIVALAREEPLCAAELERRLRGLRRSAMRRRLTELRRQNVLIRETGEGATVYKLTEGVRRLGLPMVLAARWEWRHARPERHLPATDLAGIVHLLAPIVRVPRRLNATCSLHVDSRRSIEPDIHLTALNGGLFALSANPERVPCVEGLGTSEAWCESLLEGRLQGLAVVGEQSFLEVVVARLSAALYS